MRRASGSSRKSTPAPPSGLRDATTMDQVSFPSLSEEPQSPARGGKPRQRTKSETKSSPSKRAPQKEGRTAGRASLDAMPMSTLEFLRSGASPIPRSPSLGVSQPDRNLTLAALQASPQVGKRSNVSGLRTTEAFEDDGGFEPNASTSSLLGVGLAFGGGANGSTEILSPVGPGRQPSRLPPVVTSSPQATIPRMWQAADANSEPRHSLDGHEAEAPEVEAAPPVPNISSYLKNGPTRAHSSAPTEGTVASWRTAKSSFGTPEQGAQPDLPPANKARDSTGSGVVSAGNERMSLATFGSGNDARQSQIDPKRNTFGGLDPLLRSGGESSPAKANPELTVTEIERNLAAIEAALHDNSIAGSFDPSIIRGLGSPEQPLTASLNLNATAESPTKASGQTGERISLQPGSHEAIALAVKEVRHALSQSQLSRDAEEQVEEMQPEDDVGDETAGTMHRLISHDSTPARNARLRQRSMREVEETYGRMVNIVTASAGIVPSPMPTHLGVFAASQDTPSRTSREYKPSSQWRREILSMDESAIDPSLQDRELSWKPESVEQGSNRETLQTSPSVSNKIQGTPNLATTSRDSQPWSYRPDLQGLTRSSSERVQIHRQAEAGETNESSYESRFRSSSRTSQLRQNVRPQSRYSVFEGSVRGGGLPAVLDDPGADQRTIGSGYASPVLTQNLPALQRRHNLEKNSLLDALERAKTSAEQYRQQNEQLQTDLHAEVARLLELERAYEQSLNREATMQEKIEELEQQLHTEREARLDLLETLERLSAQQVGNASQTHSSINHPTESSFLREESRSADGAAGRPTATRNGSRGPLPPIPSSNGDASGDFPSFTSSRLITASPIMTTRIYDDDRHLTSSDEDDEEEEEEEEPVQRPNAKQHEANWFSRQPSSVLETPVKRVRQESPQREEEEQAEPIEEIAGGGDETFDSQASEAAGAGGMPVRSYPSELGLHMNSQEMSWGALVDEQMPGDGDDDEEEEAGGYSHLATPDRSRGLKEADGVSVAAATPGHLPRQAPASSAAEAGPVPRSVSFADVPEAGESSGAEAEQPQLRMLGSVPMSASSSIADGSPTPAAAASAGAGARSSTAKRTGGGSSIASSGITSPASSIRGAPASASNSSNPSAAAHARRRSGLPVPGSRIVSGGSAAGSSGIPRSASSGITSPPGASSSTFGTGKRAAPAASGAGAGPTATAPMQKRLSGGGSSGSAASGLLATTGSGVLPRGPATAQARASAIVASASSPSGFFTSLPTTPSSNAAAAAAEAKAKQLQLQQQQKQAATGGKLGSFLPRATRIPSASLASASLRKASGVSAHTLGGNTSAGDSSFTTRSESPIGAFVPGPRGGAGGGGGFYDTRRPAGYDSKRVPEALRRIAADDDDDEEEE